MEPPDIMDLVRHRGFPVTGGTKTRHYRPSSLRLLDRKGWIDPNHLTIDGLSNTTSLPSALTRHRQEHGLPTLLNAELTRRQTYILSNGTVRIDTDFVSRSTPI